MNTTNEYTKVFTVTDIPEATHKISELQRDGFEKENIFVLTHDAKRTQQVSEETDAQMIGIAEEGVLTTVANFFRSTGDELRAKLLSMGVSEEKSEQLESEMDQGKIIIIAWTGKDSYNPPNATNILI